MFEWLCIATVILYFSTNGTRRGTVFRFDDAVISFTPSVLGLIEALLDLEVREAVVEAQVVGLQHHPGVLELTS